ncbi:hypothetical protein ABZ801_00700 [Actinomadura sp. NPDC047616]|uniref:hypothetical protein n=1 Tax=Actinomadura sp. NPDC047616 TaxID=3155914 RepID=UPI0033CC593D
MTGMPPERDADRLAADRLAADPRLVQVKLDEDIAEIRNLGRSPVGVDPRAPESHVSVARASAGILCFESPTEAATMSLRRIDELPVAERSGSAITAYHLAASRTVAEGDLQRATATQLVFHRPASEAAGTTITLEAVLRITGAGEMWLDSFGWPRTVQNVRTLAFAGSPAAYYEQGLADLANDAPIDRALLMLLAASLTNSGPYGGQEERERLIELAAGRRHRLAAFVSATESRALAVRADSRFGACLYRSMLATLSEDYLGSATMSLLDMEEIDDIDEELRDALSQSDALPEEMIPAGTSPGHWWWYA